MAAQPSLMDRLFRRKPVQALVEETAGDPKLGHLERSIGLFQLTMFGVGATIGTGIFIVLTTAVPKAGPGVVLSFAIAGVTAPPRRARGPRPPDVPFRGRLRHREHGRQ